MSDLPQLAAVGYATLRKPIDAVMGTILPGLYAKLALDR